MKVSLISDLHFGVRKNSEIFLNTQLKFMNEQFVPYLKENNIKYIFILGDLFDNRNSTNIKVMNAVYEMFRNVLSDFIIYVIVGNHDCYLNNSIEINSLKFLENFDNVTVVDKIKEIELDNKKIVMVPWIVDNISFIRDFNKINGDVCFGHFNLNGFHYNKYKISEDGLQDKIFNKYKKIFTGHFHIRTSQYIQGSEFVYIGSPFQLTRNDIDECRGFTVLDLSDIKYEYEFVDNNVSLKYIKLRYPEKFSENKVKNNIVDVYIDYDETYNENKLEKYIKLIEKYMPITSPNIFIENNSELNGDLDLDKCNIGSMVDLMKEYINSLDINNKDEIYKSLIDLYNEVKGDF